MIEGSNLVKGFKILVAILAIAVALYVLLPVGGLVQGSITNTAVGTWNGTTGGGDVNVSGAMMTAIQGYETSFIADSNSISSNSGTIIGLVAIVVIITVFGIQGLLKKSFGGKGVN